ncbi:MAG TPA: hypothetical protein DC049_13560 [Spirochaetia bacterium]|nr:hypothetical protein [Spirochaetia bacterium]
MNIKDLIKKIIFFCRIAAFFLLLLINSFAEGITENSLAAKTKELTSYFIEYFMHPKTRLIYQEQIKGERKQEFETPEEIKKGNVAGKLDARGYGSGIQNTSLFTGHLLYALIEAYEAKNDPDLEKWIKDFFQGMKLLGSISPVPGFVPRGPHPDDFTAYYTDSSVDQHTTYVYALWRYYRSKFASDSDKKFIRESVEKVGKRLEESAWLIKVEDNSKKAHASGAPMINMTSENAAVLLCLLSAFYDITGNNHWLDLYKIFSAENNGERWKMLVPDDKSELGNIYYVNQKAFQLNTLYLIEKDIEKRKIILAALKKHAQRQLDRTYPDGKDLEKLQVKLTDTLKQELKWSSVPFNGMFKAWEMYVPGLKGTTGILAHTYCVRMPLTGFVMAMFSHDKELVKKTSSVIWEMMNKVPYRELGGVEINLYMAVTALQLYKDYFSPKE